MATGVLCDKKVPIRLKSKIYRTVVRLVALYECECWPTTKALERVLHAMEMRWREEDSVAKTALKLDVSGVRPRGRPKIRWLDCVKLDMIDARLCAADAMDRTKWKTRSRKADPATTRDKRWEEEDLFVNYILRNSEVLDRVDYNCV
ncbi:hypothetical protein RB195_013929 [Necator americanus]